MYEVDERKTMSCTNDQLTNPAASLGIAASAQHLNWSTIPIEHPGKGIERQLVVGERMMICRFRFEPSLVTPEHTHPHEQMSLVISGRVRFFIEGEERIASPGDRPALSVKLFARSHDDGRGSSASRYLHSRARRFFRPLKPPFSDWVEFLRLVRVDRLYMSARSSTHTNQPNKADEENIPPLAVVVLVVYW
jgi:hypothetical protein